MSLSPEDELLTTTGIPRWIRWGASVIAVGLVVALVVLTAAHSDDGTPLPTPVAAPPSTGPVPLGIPRGPANAEPYSLPMRVPPSDVATDSKLTWVVQGNTLYRLDPFGYAGVSLPGVDSSAADRVRLILDRPRNQLWVVVLGTPHSSPQVFNAASLRRLGSTPWARPITAAAAAQGHLYLADPAGLFRIETFGGVTPIRLPADETVLDVVPDPARARVLILTRSGTTLSVSDVDSKGLQITARAPLGLREGTLGVTGSGDIWVAGVGAIGGVLARVDPETLQLVANSALTSQLGSGAVLLASGTDSLLIAPGTGQALLWCIDGHDGTPVQEWRIRAHRAGLSRGRAFATVGRAMLRLELAGRCTG